MAGSCYHGIVAPQRWTTQDPPPTEENHGVENEEEGRIGKKPTEKITSPWLILELTNCLQCQSLYPLDHRTLPGIGKMVSLGFQNPLIQLLLF